MSTPRIDNLYNSSIYRTMITKEKIMEARKAVGESQAIFARRFGVEQVTIHRWETMGIPTTGTTRVLIERVLAEIMVQDIAATG